MLMPDSCHMMVPSFWRLYWACINALFIAFELHNISLGAAKIKELSLITHVVCTCAQILSLALWGGGAFGVLLRPSFMENLSKRLWLVMGWAFIAINRSLMGLCFSRQSTALYCLASHGWLFWGVPWWYAVDWCFWGWLRAVLFDGQCGEGEDSMLKDDIYKKNLG